MAKVGDTRIARKSDVAPSKCSPTETNTKNGETAFETKKAFFEPNASGLSRGEDQASEMTSFGWDHGASFTGNPPEAVVQLRIVSS